MKFSHKVFHLDKDIEREHLYKSINDYIGQYSSELDSPTIEISCREHLDNFYNTSDIRFSNTGYEFNNEIGWRFGELGIWASNIAAYKKFLETDSDCLILIEDDIEYMPGFFDNLLYYMSQLPNDWDAFFYYAPDNGSHNVSQEFLTIEPDKINICKTYQDWSCLCYIINRNTAKRILDDIVNPINLPLDYYFFRQPDKYNAYTVKPTSKLYCRIANMKSTFQHKQKREVLN